MDELRCIESVIPTGLLFSGDARRHEPIKGQLPIFTRVPDSQYVDVAFLKFVAHLVVTH